MEYVFLLVWWFSWERVNDDEIKTDVYATQRQCVIAKRHIEKLCEKKSPMMSCEVVCLKKKIVEAPK